MDKINMVYRNKYYKANISDNRRTYQIVWRLKEGEERSTRKIYEVRSSIKKCKGKLCKPWRAEVINVVRRREV